MWRMKNSRVERAKYFIIRMLILVKTILPWPLASLLIAAPHDDTGVKVEQVKYVAR